MSTFDFIIDKIRFSYSSTSTFGTCAHSFKLTYIDSMPRENNFYAEYGTLIHQCFEEYFNGKLDYFELSEYYKNQYDLIIQAPVPSAELGDRYKAEGKAFFDNFYFEKEKYDILVVEDKIDFMRGNTMFVAKPDLILRDKETGLNILYDYKTATPYRNDKWTGKEIVDKKKIAGYIKQMFLYTYALRVHRDIPIDRIVLWYPRLDRMETTVWSLDKEEESLAFIDNLVKRIREDEFFAPDTSSPFFCDNLCSVRKYCKYR